MKTMYPEKKRRDNVDKSEKFDKNPDFYRSIGEQQRTDQEKHDKGHRVFIRRDDERKDHPHYQKKAPKKINENFQSGIAQLAVSGDEEKRNIHDEDAQIQPFSDSENFRKQGKDE